MFKTSEEEEVLEYDSSPETVEPAEKKQKTSELDTTLGKCFAHFIQTLRYFCLCVFLDLCDCL